MSRRNVAADEARDLRGALDAIGRIVGLAGVTPRGKLQQIAGVLFLFNVPVKTTAVVLPKVLKTAPLKELMTGTVE